MCTLRPWSHTQPKPARRAPGLNGSSRTCFGQCFLRTSGLRGGFRVPSVPSSMWRAAHVAQLLLRIMQLALPFHDTGAGDVPHIGASRPSAGSSSFAGLVHRTARGTLTPTRYDGSATLGTRMTCGCCYGGMARPYIGEPGAGTMRHAHGPGVTTGPRIGDGGGRMVRSGRLSQNAQASQLPSTCSACWPVVSRVTRI